MSNKLYEETSVQNIADAIRSVYGTNKTYKIAEMASAIQKLGVNPNDVEFYDYDGTLLYSYSSSEFADLTELPPNPSHTGLTAQGWNWTLSDAKTYVATYGKLIIGQTYITADGKTKLYINVGKDFTMTMGFNQSDASGVIVDWGDNSSTSSEATTGQVSFSHTYTTAGQYVISLTVSSGTLQFNGPIDNDDTNKTSGTSAKCSIKKVELGSNATFVSANCYAFSGCLALSSITIPSGIPHTGQRTFYNCLNLKYVTLPSGCTKIESYAFYNNRALKTISLPKSLSTTNSFGTYMFTGCHSLKKITIPKGENILPSRTFQNCYALDTVVLPDSITRLDTYSFDGCNGLENIRTSKITVYSSYCLRNCYCLSNIELKSGITSITDACFSGCYSFTSITLPSTVTAINAAAFANDISLQEIIINATTPPTLTADATSFDTLPSNYVIYVPSGTRATYVADATWGLFASHIVEQS